MITEDIYSKTNKDLLLHQYISLGSFEDLLHRENISSEDQSLQLALIPLKHLQTFRPHYHVEHVRPMPKAQESWIVIRGSVQVTYYDIDNTIIAERTLMPGDATITYHGGHNYQCTSENAIVYEVKTGPYLGAKYDKAQINS